GRGSPAGPDSPMSFYRPAESRASVSPSPVMLPGPIRQGGRHGATHMWGERISRRTYHQLKHHAMHLVQQLLTLARAVSVSDPAKAAAPLTSGACGGLVSVLLHRPSLLSWPVSGAMGLGAAATPP